MKQALVLGSSGEMGRRVVLLADRLLPDTSIVIGVHRDNPWPGRATREVDIFDAASLSRALDGMDALVNAVGPYSYDPAPLVRACLTTGCHYVDLPEEPLFLARVREATLHYGAATRPSAVLPGCSTLPGLVEVLIQPWADLREVARVRVFLSMGSSNPVVPGLMYGMLRPLGRRDQEGHRAFGHLRRRSYQGGTSRLPGRYPSLLGPGGLLLGERRVPVGLWVGFDRAWLNSGLLALSRPFSMLPDRWLRRTIGIVLPGMPALRRLGTPTGYLAIEAQDEHSRVVGEVEVRADREGLNVAALPSVWAVRRLLEGGPHNDVVSLDQLVTFQEATEWLEQEGYAVRRVSGVQRRA